MQVSINRMGRERTTAHNRSVLNDSETTDRS